MESFKIVFDIGVELLDICWLGIGDIEQFNAANSSKRLFCVLLPELI